MIASLKNSRKSARARIKLVQDLANEELLDLAFTKGLNHLVQKAKAETLRELRTSYLMTENLDTFLEFPVSSCLRPKVAGLEAEKSLTLFDRTFYTIEDKEPVLNEIGTLFDESRLNTSLRDDVILTANEFICNVLFNAPCAKGINKKSLTATIKMATKLDHPPGILKIGAYNGYLALACQDGYGSLNPMNVLNRVKICLQNGPGKAMNYADRGTAGIGSYLVFSACTSLFMGVKQGKTSQFCALFPLRSGAKARNLMKKNLHWVESQSALKWRFLAALKLTLKPLSK